VGTLTFALAALCAFLLHGSEAAAGVRAQTSGALGIALGYALVTWGFVSLEVTSLGEWERNFPDVLLLAAGLALVIAPRLPAEEPVPESR
jgi:hypothetical protein